MSVAKELVFREVFSRLSFKKGESADVRVFVGGCSSRKGPRTQIIGVQGPNTMILMVFGP